MQVKLATADDLRRGFEELGVRMPIQENGKRPTLAGVINDVLATMADTRAAEEGGIVSTPSVSSFCHPSCSQCIKRRIRLGS